MSTAQIAALQTPELLTAILLHLPLRDLLLAQSVSHSWRNLLSTSPTLQQALFFTPIHQAPTDIQETTLNSLLVSKFSLLFPAPESYDRPTIDGKSLKTLDLAQARDAYMRPSASWRRMLVLQPSGQKLVVIHASDGIMGPLERGAEIPFAEGDGLRMGLLWDILVEPLARKFSYAQVEWPLRELDFKRMLENIAKSERKIEAPARNENEIHMRLLEKGRMKLLMKRLEKACRKRDMGERNVVLEIKTYQSCISGDDSDEEDEPAHDFVSEGKGAVNLVYSAWH